MKIVDSELHVNAIVAPQVHQHCSLCQIGQGKGIHQKCPSRFTNLCPRIQRLHVDPYPWTRSGGGGAGAQGGARTPVRAWTRAGAQTFDITVRLTRGTSLLICFICVNLPVAVDCSLISQLFFVLHFCVLVLPICKRLPWNWARRIAHVALVRSSLASKFCSSHYYRLKLASCFVYLRLHQHCHGNLLVAALYCPITLFSVHG